MNDEATMGIELLIKPQPFAAEHYATVKRITGDMMAF